MNKEEMIRKAYKIASMPNDDTSLKELIDEIYEEFESRVCANCEYLRMFDICNNIDSYAYDCHISDLEFGCNKFERVKDGN